MELIQEKLSSEIKNEYTKGVILSENNHSLLSKEDEKNLIRLAQLNDQTALSLLSKYNHRFVLKIARKYQNRGIEFDDLVSEGKIGFLHSISKFDLDKGFCLTTYATQWVRQYIEKHIMNNSRLVRIPIHLIKKISLINRTRKEMEKTLGTTPSIEEVSKKTLIDIETINNLDELNKRVAVSNSGFNANNEDTDLFNTFEDENNNLDTLEDSLTMSKTNALMDCLNPKEKSIVILTFGMYKCDETSFNEIGRQLNLSGERIRQIHQKSLLKMKTHAENNNISVSDFLSAA